MLRFTRLRHWLVPAITVLVAGLAQAGGPPREVMRAAVESHRASQREEIRAEEAVAGRRLTPAERAELREQLRSEWLAHSEATQAVDASAPGQAPSGGSQNTVTGWRAFLPWAWNSP